MNITSKFPNMETTIFSQISVLASKHQATNLGQGFPNFGADPYLIERLNYHTSQGVNQYAPMTGMPQLLESINKLHNNGEVTITSGATEAIFCAISAIVHPGDEVIVFDPSYDSYVPNIELNGGIANRINLSSDFSIDWNLVKSKITPKTKAIIINTPHNPSGNMLTQSDLDSLWELIKNRNIFIISDEVYQFITYDGRKHLSPMDDERMRDRTFAISSFGKTFHVTGWKVGYCRTCEKLTKEFRKIHQYITFCTPGNIQLAISDMLEKKMANVNELSSFYQNKRDLFANALRYSNFKLLPVEGSYFQLVDYSELSESDDVEFCQQLIIEHGVAAIPTSVFYQTPPKQRIIRFCFAKKDETLISGLQILKELKA